MLTLNNLSKAIPNWLIKSAIRSKDLIIKSNLKSSLRSKYNFSKNLTHTRELICNKQTNFNTMIRYQYFQVRWSAFNLDYAHGHNSLWFLSDWLISYGKHYMLYCIYQFYLPIKSEAHMRKGCIYFVMKGACY